MSMYHSKFDDGRHYFRFGKNTLVVEPAKGMRYIGFSLENDEDLTVAFHLWRALYISYSHDSRRWHTMMPQDKNIFSWHLDLKGWIFGMDIWNDIWNPESRHWYIFIADKLFGRLKHQEPELIDSGDTTVVMPEKVYPATYKVEKRTWKRRIGRAKHKISVDIEIPGGIPIPGKGENSWDLDDDATYSSYRTFDKRPSVHDVSKELALDLLKTRQQRAGLNWLPTAKKAKPEANHPKRLEGEINE